MCGICGFVATTDSSALADMMDALRHRGPDDEGAWETDNVALGMRRLAIVDPETGKQPVCNEDGSLILVFNGEIYNHKALRAELQQAGHVFRSHHSDTEVLIHGYEEWGEDFLSRLNGMFAIALWDKRTKRLFLARDRAGVKPLYFSQVGDKLVFASEIKSLLRHPAVGREPDFRSLYHYFTFKNIPAPWTAWRGIEQLLPGECAVFADGRLSRRRWWRLRFGDEVDITEAEAALRVRELLEDAVRLRMECDVPFGAYLSGGVDSSAVVALMSRISPRPIQTFSLIYDDAIGHKAPDRDFARQMSRFCGTEHHEYLLRPGEVEESLDDVLSAFDEPFSGVTSTYFLTRLISRYVKVALSGDGADELFGSYASHRMARPLSLLDLRGGAAGLTPEDLEQFGSYAGRLDEVEALRSRGGEASRRMGLYLWDEAGKRSLLSEKMLALSHGADSEALVRGLYAAANSDDPLNRALAVDFESLLPDQVLAFVDRLSMAHSVEVRNPFLDFRLMEFVARAPSTMKIRRGRVKHLLKEAVRDLIPDAILERPKEGFVLPVNDWLLGQLRALAGNTLAPARLARHGLLRPEHVAALLAEHYGPQGGQHGPRLWNLIMFQLWWEKEFG